MLSFNHNRRWLSVARAPSRDNPLTYTWEERLHGIMLGFALLAERKR